MDGNFAPNCAALLELGRKFLLLLDNAPSHACRLACDRDHYRTVLHGTVAFQPPSQTFVNELKTSSVSNSVFL